VDLVPREDHFLCFVHFHSWKIDDPSVNCLRVRPPPLTLTCCRDAGSRHACVLRAAAQNRLLNPPSFEHKESVDYIHPVSGPQRWLFSRSRVPPRPQKTSSRCDVARVAVLLSRQPCRDPSSLLPLCCRMVLACHFLL
jgi:hypothetical protein